MGFLPPTLRLASPGEIRPVRREALRYLGYGKAQPGPDVDALLDSCEEELCPAMLGRACWMRVPLSFPAAHTVDLGVFTVESVSLARHLAGCHSALLFAATVGAGADRLIARHGRLSPSRAAVIDALASSAVEHWCDMAEQEATEGEEKHCERFSPGYGDFPLHHQEDITRCLDTGRLLGLTLSGSLLLTPSKSVTAVIGLGASARTCGNKCMFCNKENCIYREVMI